MAREAQITVRLDGMEGVKGLIDRLQAERDEARRSAEAMGDALARNVQRAEQAEARLADVAHHLVRLEVWCRDATRDDGQALGGIVADLRRAVDGGPDGE